jgi:hypothetical protein
VPRLNHFVSAIVSVVVSVTILPNVTLAESPAKESVNIVAITKPAVIQSLTIEDDIKFDFEGCRQNVQTNDVFCVGNLHSKTEQSFRVYRDFIRPPAKVQR